MAGLVPPELKRRFDERVSPHHGLKQARIGAVINGEQVVQAPGRQGWVYVTLTEPSDVGVTEAINLSTRWAYGAPVYVRRGPRGHMEVVSVDAAAAVTEAGNSATMLAVPDIALTGIVDERRFEPGLVQIKRLAGAYTMSVWINSFAYTYQGARKTYPGGWLDLTTYAPGADMRRLVLVGVNMATNTTIAVAGSEYGLATNFTYDNLNEIVAPDSMKVLAAVNLHYGMAAIDNDAYLIEAREFLGGGGVSSFLGLTDVTPASYSGKAGQLVVVNAAETGLEFQEASGVGPFDVDLAPDTPSAYDDEFDDASIDGDWSEVDPNGYMTPTEADGVLTLANNATDFTPDVPTMLVRTLPAGDWAVATKVLSTATTNPILAGIGVVFPTSGHYVFLELVDDISRHLLQLQMNDGGAYTIEISTELTITDWCYLRLRYDDSEALMVGEYSTDGLAWTSVQLDISGLGEAPVSFGPCIRPWGNQDDIEAKFEFWRVVEAFGASTDPIYGNYGAPLAFDATQIAFTPTTGGNWTGAPTTVQEALDELAARVKELE